MGLIGKVLKKRGLTKTNLKKERLSNFKWLELERVAHKVVEELFLGGDGLVVGVLYDVDVDGLFSGYIMEDYLTRKGIEVKRYMNKGKAHGIQERNLQGYIDDGLDWLIVVDAGSGDGERIKYLTDRGIKVLVLDHHPYKNEVELDDEMSWILNVVDEPELPKLSGCGVVYRFIEELSDYFEDMVGQYEKYVGITVLSDSCDMSDPENRYYVQRAYEEFRGNYFLQQFPFYGSWKSYYSYSVIPYMNACIRVGEERQIMELVNGMNNRAKTNKIPRDTKRVKTKQEGLIEELFTESKEIKKKGITFLLRRTKPELRPVGGLAANKLINEYEQPALVLYRDGDKWVGSFRSNSYTKKVLEGYGITAEGHDHACGVYVDNDVLKKFVKTFTLDIESTLNKPDFLVSLNKVTDKVWMELARFNEFAGTNMEKVLVKLKENYGDADYVEEVGKSKRILVYGELEVIDFSGSTEEEIIVEPVLKDTEYQLIRI